MNDILAFIRAQLDTDEELAHSAAGANPGAAARHWSAEQVDRQSPTNGIWRKCWAIVPKRVKGIVLAEVPTDILPRVVKHIEAHDPARVLRQVQAHRAILDDLAAVIRDDEGLTDFGEGHAGLHVARRTLRALVSIYSDRDGYRTEWATPGSTPHSPCPPADS